VLIPMQCEYYALEGLTQLLNTIKLIQQALNPRLEIEGILLTMFDARLNLSHEVAEETRKFFPGRVYETVIPRNVRLSEAPSFGKPVLEYDPECAGAQFYLKLAREVLKLPEDAEPIAVTEPSEAAPDATAPTHVEAITEDVAAEGASLTEEAPALTEEAPAFQEVYEPETVEPALDRDALEVEEIAARLIQADAVPTESDVDASPLETGPTENVEPMPLEAESQETDTTPVVAESPTEPISAAGETPEVLEDQRTGVPERVEVSPLDDQAAEEPIVLSSDDLADDVLTLPEESIVRGEEDAIPEPAPIPNETQTETTYTAETHEPESKTPESETRYDELQPMNTQDAHPQEELVSHD